ncbi:MAG: T9SS type A sorting domain-containing protein, partial [Bacteroidales bacterium]|nr:T9SS type A sorting domain-containing protein [Bacteroidales bacterium]
YSFNLTEADKQFNILQPYPLQFNFFTDIMSTIFGLVSANYSVVYYRLMSEGAQEMLVNHISGHLEFNDLQDFLTDLGFPENSRNVAFANGSDEGTHQGIEPGSPYFPEISTITFPLRTSVECKYSGVNQNLFVFGITLKLWFFGWNTIAVIGDYYTFDEKIYPDAPAGYWDSNDDMDFRIAFLPTVSAIDLNQELIDLHNLDYFVIDEEEQTKEWYINNGDVPFDDIYSASINSKHINKTPGLNINQNLEINEIMYDNMHLQNRTINNTRDFEASEMIMAGRDITPVVWDKTIDINDFVVANGGDVTFTAGETIRLEAGFKVEPGGHFSAHIDNNLSNKKSNNLIEIPKIAGTKYAYIQKTYFVQNSNNDDIISWRLTGEETNIYSYGFDFNVPSNLNCGQYTLYCTKTDNTGSATFTKVIVVSSDSKRETLKQFINPVITRNISEPEKLLNTCEIKIYPNPNPGIFNIELYEEGILEFSVEVLNSMGKAVYEKQNIPTGKTQINITSQPKGIYFIKVQAGEKVYTEKVIYK